MAKYKLMVIDFALLAVTMVWGSTYVVVKSNLNGANSITLLCYQSLIAVGLLTILLVILRKNPWRGFGQGMLLGIMQSAFFLGEAACLYFTPATNAAFITGLFPIFIPIYSFCFLKTKPNVSLLLAVVFSLFGLWFITDGIKGINLGDLLVLGSTMIGSMRIFVAHHFLKQEAHPLVLNFQQLLTLFIVSVSVVLMLHIPFALKTTHAVYALLYLGIFATFGCYLIQAYSLTLASPVKVSMFNIMVPIFGAAFAWTVGGEAFSWHKLVGGGFIVLAMFFAKARLLPSFGSWKLTKAKV